MVDPDWGWEADRASFHVRADDEDPVDSDDVDDLDEVAEARRQGWFPLGEAPLWCFVPAVWPADARVWVRDRRIRHLTKQCEDGRLERMPWSAADYFEVEDDYNRFLTEYGVPPRPPGRIWLLRLPAAYGNLVEVLSDIWDSWRTAGGEDPPGPELVRHTARRLREIF